jgi:hypothetical protein
MQTTTLVRIICNAVSLVGINAIWAWLYIVTKKAHKAEIAEITNTEQSRADSWRKRFFENDRQWQQAYTDLLNDKGIQVCSRCGSIENVSNYGSYEAGDYFLCDICHDDMFG